MFYRLILMVVFALAVTAVLARNSQIAPTVAESEVQRSAQSAQAPGSSIAAAQSPSVPPGVPGPTTALLRMMGVDQPGFGIRVAQTFDASGPPAYETQGGDLLFFTNASVSYNSTADKPMVIVINAKTREIIALADIDMPSSPHGITLSPDGKYIYLPSGWGTGPAGRGVAPTAVVDAKTLKLAALIHTGGETHHTQVFGDRYVMFDSFRGPLPIFLLDPATNTVVRGIPAGDFNGRPYIAFSSPDAKFIYVTVRPGIRRDSHGEEVDGWLSKINAETMQEVATFPVGPGPVWTAITQDGRTGYVTLGPSSRLVKLDLETGEILGIAPTGRGPYGIRLSPDETIAYVTSKGEGGNGQKGATFAAIDTQAMTLIREQLSCPDGLCQADHIVLSPDGEELWISNNLGTITVFDRETLNLLATIQTPKLADPHGGAFLQIAPDNQSALLVADIGGPHNGVSPYQPAADRTVRSARAASNTLTIVARDSMFLPGNLEVAAGETLTLEFDNQDGIDHNILSADGSFREVILGGGQSRTVEWTAPDVVGPMKLICTYHPGMEMTLDLK